MKSGLYAVVSPKLFERKEGKKVCLFVQASSGNYTAHKKNYDGLCFTASLFQIIYCRRKYTSVGTVKHSVTLNN